MRLSSSSAEIATASTSRSVRSAKFFISGPGSHFRTVLNCIEARLRGQTLRFALPLLLLRMMQEFQQQPADLLRLFLLHPMAGAIEEVTAEHSGAGAPLHRLKHARALVGAPVLLARNETGGHIDAAARPGLQFGREPGRRATAIPLQPALKSGARVFGAVERELLFRKPAVGSYDCCRRHFLRDRLGHVLR